MQDAYRFPATTTVCVRDFPILADIGINPDEIGRRQPLVISVELQIVADGIVEIGQTVDYRQIAKAVEELASVHIPLIETFAHKLACLCVAFSGVSRARVSVDKPFAMKGGLAGVVVVLDAAD